MGYIFLGHINANRESVINLSLDEEIDLEPGDSLIVIGEN